MLKMFAGDDHCTASYRLDCCPQVQCRGLAEPGEAKLVLDDDTSVSSGSYRASATYAGTTKTACEAALRGEISYAVVDGRPPSKAVHPCSGKEVVMDCR